MTERMSDRTLLVFLASLVLFTWIVQVVAILLVRGDLNSPEAMPFLVATMFVPTVWSLAWLRFDRRRWSTVDWKAGRLAWLPMGALIPAGMVFLAFALVATSGWATSTYFTFEGWKVVVNRGPWLLGTGSQGWIVFVANVAATAIAFAALNGVAAVGEEFGWRGVLQRQLIERFGVARGIALLGVVWAYWHLPVNLAGYNFPDYPVLGALVLFPLQLVAASFVLAWLTIRARSFWPAVLFHGSVNGVYEGLLRSLTPAVPRLQVDVVFVLVEVALGLVCLRLLVRRGDARDHASRGERGEGLCLTS